MQSWKKSDMTRITCEGNHSACHWKFKACLKHNVESHSFIHLFIYSLIQQIFVENLLMLGVICPQSWGQGREESRYILIILRLNIYLEEAAINKQQYIL